MALFEDLSTEINDRAAESVEQDQTPCPCRPILPYTLCKMNPWLQTTG